MQKTLGDTLRSNRLLAASTLAHFLRHSKTWINSVLGRGVPSDFDAEAYLQLNKDVRQAGVEPEYHYIKYGRTERRKYRKRDRELPHFERDYNAFVADLCRTLPRGEAMAEAVGGYFNEYGFAQLDLLERFAGLTDGISVVDFGCGSGRTAVQIAKRFPRCSYVGLDVVQELLDHATTLCPAAYRFVHNSELSLPLPDESVDLLVAFSVFTHLLYEEIYAYLQDASRILRPGGKIAMSFLEFDNINHWAAFSAAVEIRKGGRSAPMNTFVERSTIDLWANKLGLSIEGYFDTAIGQTLAVLRKCEGAPYREPKATGRPAGEILPSNNITQLFRVDRNYLCGVSITIGTYHKVQRCHLKLSLYKLTRARAKLIHAIWTDDSGSGLARSKAAHHFAKLMDRYSWLERAVLPKRLLLAETTQCCDSILDNSDLELCIEPDNASQGALYLLRLSSPDALPGRAVTVWLTEGEDRVAGHVWCSIGRRKSEFGVLAKSRFAPPLAESSVPPQLLISTTTQCNLNCIHCISRETRNGVNRLSQRIRSELQQLANQGLLKGAATDYSGDILWSDARFGGDLDFMFGLNVPFHLDTNGVWLDGATSKRLMTSRVRSINVSLDAGRDETFRRVRKGAPPLHEIVSKMRDLAHERARSERADVRLSIGFTLMKSTIDELPEVLSLARSVGFDAVITRHIEAYTADMACESLWHDKERFNAARVDAIGLAGALGLGLEIGGPLASGAIRKGHTFCAEPWRSAVVLGNGDVRVCCVPGPGMLMGNLNELPMEEIWNGPKYQHFRSIVNSDNPPLVCNACPIYRIANNPESYMPFLIAEHTDQASRHVPVVPSTATAQRAAGRIPARRKERNG